MVADAIILIGTAVLVMIVIFAVGSYIIGILKPAAVDLFLGIPLIGDLGCEAPSTNAPTPYFIFGKPGYSQLGCIHEFMIYTGLIIMAISIAVGTLMLMFRTLSNASLVEWAKFLGIALFSLLLIPLFHVFYDVIAGSITTFAIWIASLPHGETSGFDDMKDKAGDSLMLPFDKMRDYSTISGNCIIPVDQDGDGRVDKYDIDTLCLLGSAFTTNFFETLMIFTIGNMISIMTTLVLFIATIIRFLLTGVLAVAFPLIFALSRIPKVGEVFNHWTEALIGLMAAPILIAVVAAVAPVVILDELEQLGTTSPDTQKYVAFIMFVAMAYTYLAIIIGSAKFLGTVILSATGVVMGAAMAGFGALMGTARAGGSAIMTGAMGAGAGRAFSAGFGFAPGAGGAGLGYAIGSGRHGFAGSGEEVARGAPANAMVESVPQTKYGSIHSPSHGTSWNGPAESFSSHHPKIARMGTIGAAFTTGALSSWGRSMEYSAHSVHPSAKEAERIHHDTDRMWDINEDGKIDEEDKDMIEELYGNQQVSSSKQIEDKEK